IIGSQSYQAVSNEAIRLRNRPDLAKAELKELTANAGMEQWAKESYDLAVEVAYAKGTLKGSNDRNDGPVLPTGYTDVAKAVAERRVVLAGYRLNDVLHEIYGE
ncbi:MAG TPA: S1/P1 nuclease, partial [Tepidisphaeraceae bacterium]|nr:S1/P1 nuclease [Tepidisphaeraceae bacterium]